MSAIKRHSGGKHGVNVDKPTRRLWPIGFFLLWTLFVLYPNPFQLAQSLFRVASPPLDSQAISYLLEDLPNDPEAIESFVLQAFPYQYDWITYNVPWYFPTLSEAVEKGTGDCKTRFVVFASLLDALEIPYVKSYSLTHFWVIYKDKEETSIERERNAWLLQDEEGARFQIPKEDPYQVWRVFRQAFWEPMPPLRKSLLVAGFPASFALSARLRNRRTRGQPDPS